MSKNVHTILIRGNYRGEGFSVCFQRDGENWLADIELGGGRESWTCRLKRSVRPGMTVAMYLVSRRKLQRLVHQRAAKTH